MTVVQDGVTFVIDHKFMKIAAFASEEENEVSIRINLAQDMLGALI